MKMKVLIKILEWKKQDLSPIGKIIKVLGKPIQSIPVYLNIGIIDERKIVVNFASLFQYFAPIVFGIISEKSKIIIVITVETKPTKNSSEIPPAKKVFLRFNSE